MTHWANAYVGKPYVSNGRDIDGFDCWGLVCLIYRDHLGVDLPSYGAIDAADLLRVAKEMEMGPYFGCWEPLDKPEPFCVVSMYGRAERSRRVVHVGVMVDEATLIHAQQKTHCAIERIDSPIIRNRVAGFWRYRNADAV